MLGWPYSILVGAFAWSFKHQVPQLYWVDIYRMYLCNFICSQNSQNHCMKWARVFWRKLHWMMMKKVVRKYASVHMCWQIYLHNVSFIRSTKICYQRLLLVTIIMLVLQMIFNSSWCICSKHINYVPSFYQLFFQHAYLHEKYRDQVVPIIHRCEFFSYIFF